MKKISLACAFLLIFFDFSLTASYTISTYAEISSPNQMTRDASGSLYLVDGNNYVKKFSDASTVSTYCSTLPTPNQMAFDGSGNLYAACWNTQKILKRDTNGNVTTYAGSGSSGYSGDGGPATSASFNDPIALCFDSSYNLYIGDTSNCVVRKVDHSTGIISTIAGTGSSGYSGDGGPATSAALSWVYNMCVDQSNSYLYLACSKVIRRVNLSTGIITSYAGNNSNGYSGDGGPATSAQMGYYSYGTCCDTTGNLYFPDTLNNVVRKVSSDGIISTIAGNGNTGHTGDGGPGTSATLTYPSGLCIDSAGNLYVSDNQNNAIRKLTAPIPPISYFPGPDAADSTVNWRFDRVLCNQGSGFTHYTAPSASITNLVMSIGTASSVIANTSATAITTLPSTVTTLWITGDASNIDTVCGSASNCQLPTPSAPSGTLRFALTSGPSSTCKWFCGNLPNGWTVSIEPHSADPKLGTGILDRALTNPISVGNTAGLSLPSGGFTLNAPLSRKTGLSTYPPLTLTDANTTFAGAVSNLALNNSTYASIFTATSTIASPSAGFGTGGITIGSSSGSGLTNTLTIKYGSGSLPAISKINTANSVSITSQ